MVARSIRVGPRVRLKRELGREGAPVHFVSGFFNESLQLGLGREFGMQPAKYVDIDVDLYSSTSQVLGFMFGSRLIRAGTLVGYDDWWSGPCRRGWGSSDGATPSPLETGEGLAHAEAARKYGVSSSAWQEDLVFPCRHPLHKWSYLGSSTSTARHTSTDGHVEVKFRRAPYRTGAPVPCGALYELSDRYSATPKTCRSPQQRHC